MKRAFGKTCLICAEAIAGLVALVAAATALVAWLFFSGAISLDFIKPNIQAALERALPPNYSVRIEEIHAEWDGAERRFALVADHADISDRDGAAAFAAPSIALRFESGALLRGVFTPSDIEVRGLNIRLQRGIGGAFRLADATARAPDEPPADGAPPADDGSPIDDVVAQLRAAFAQSVITRLAVTDTSLQLYDLDGDLEWSVAEANLISERARGAVSSQFGFRLSGAGSGLVAAIDGEAVYSELSETLLVRYRAHDISLEEIAARIFGFGDAEISAAGALTGAATIGLDGEIIAADGVLEVSRGEMRPAPWDAAESAAIGGARAEFSFDPATETLLVETAQAQFGDNAIEASGSVGFTGAALGAPSAAQFDIEAARFRLSWPGMLPDIVDFENMRLRGDLDFAAESLTIENLYTELFSGAIEGDFHIRLARDPAGKLLSPELRADASVSGRIKPDEVLRLWPMDFALGARDWIRDYLIDADLYDARFRMDLEPGAIVVSGYNEDDGKPIRIVPDDMMRLEFQFENAVVDYIPGLTYLTDGSGSAVLGGNSFYVAGRSGRIGDIVLVSGGVDIPKTNPKGQPAYFYGVGVGDASDIVALLDMEPFGFAKIFGVDPADLSGETEVEFKFSRPMRREVTLDRIGYEATARVANFSMRDLIGDIDITDGDLTLEVTHDELNASGDIVLAGVPGHMTWKEEFFADGDSTTLTLTGVLNSDIRDEFGLATRSFLNGDVAYMARARGNGTQISTLGLHADLTNADLAFVNIGWRKPPGEFAEIVAEVEAKIDGGFRLSSLNFTGGDAMLAGVVDLDTDFRLLEADFDVARLESLADLSLSARRDAATDMLSIELRGQYLNIGPFLEPGDGGRAVDWGRGVSLSADLSRVGLKNSIELTDFTGRLVHNGDSIEELDVQATHAGSGAGIDARIAQPDAGGPRRLALRTGDAGALASGLLGITSVEGGEMTASASLAPRENPVDAGPPTPDNADADEGSAPLLFGSVEARRFRIVNAPTIAKLLAASSLTGLNDLLSGEGIAIDRFSLGFERRDEVLTIENAAMTGPSMGLTARGEIDFGADELSLNGAIAPAYTINSLFAAVPVAGRILVPREGEGLLAISYAISGPLRQPTVLVNPLSAGTPGALRGIFSPIERMLQKINNSNGRRDREE